MARRQMVPFGNYEGPDAKKRWSRVELIALSTPSPEDRKIGLEEEDEEKEAATARKRQHSARLRLAKNVLSSKQYRVLQFKLAGLKDNQIAQVLRISIPAVRTYRYEYKKKLKAGEAKESLEKRRKPSKKRHARKKNQ
jgi:DNA-binding NarL/FixJ family response regulator